MGDNDDRLLGKEKIFGGDGLKYLADLLRLTYLPGPGPGSFIETCAQKIKVTDPKNATGVCMLFKVIAVVYVCDMSITFLDLYEKIQVCRKFCVGTYFNAD